MLTIRLARIGKKKRPFYRVIVTEKTRPRNGRFVEIVGTYDPLKKPAAIELNREIVSREQWPQTRLHDGDRLEIVHFVGGGCGFGIPFCNLLT